MILSQPNDVALLIAVIGSHRSRVKGRTRLQKEVCILKHREKVPFGFGFESYYYGPYSAQLTDLLDTLIAAGLVEQSTVELDFEMCRYDYALTEKGKQLFESVEEALEKSSPKLIERLGGSVKKLEEMSIPSIVSLAKECSGIQSASD